MEQQRRGSEGRRLFRAEFQRDQIGRVVRKAVSGAAAYLRLGAHARQEDDGGRDPPGRARGSHQKATVVRRVHAMTGRKRAVVCRVLGIGRALVNRTFETSYTRKRIRRVMEIAGWTLPRNARRRTGRAHRGQIQRAVSNERWCSEGLEIACWNG